MTATASLAEAREGLGPILAARAPMLIVSDFDGTLSPIDPEPMGARIDPVARRALRTLAAIAEARPGRVELAILSGRTADDVAGRVRVGGLRYLGNHGIEAGVLARGQRAASLAVELDRGLHRHVPVATALGGAIRRRLGNPAWLFVEPKGPAIAFHFRQAPDPDAAREEVLEALDAEEREGGVEGLVRFEGRRIVELRPVGAGAKGAAVRRLIDELRPGGVLVMGDDHTDAEAFSVVARKRERGELAGLNVGVHAHSEIPAEVVATADLILDRPRDAARLLSALANELSKEVAAGR